MYVRAGEEAVFVLLEEYVAGPDVSVLGGDASGVGDCAADEATECVVAVGDGEPELPGGVEALQPDQPVLGVVGVEAGAVRTGAAGAQVTAATAPQSASCAPRSAGGSSGFAGEKVAPAISVP